mmetsp:Transcript_15696/g.42786  ORF Transcript_15696/g.42786 Transcript_15696/m.42786 type:complete len:230 (-) Transcript_15696:81-770(-)|eukprot:CAMPEP_0194539404 /NCGR_PEP_ID=MMETSP0253-20130528/79360_1 /TAXON_ID=2966 /ORGANISM="Noctiluca scintillans" /LENGTH=229 /DNA_ID=CAMNT_0039385683 /DNA_START=36 /DNA_END=725 /DNA_ORIENTATION=+
MTWEANTSYGAPVSGVVDPYSTSLFGGFHDSAKPTSSLAPSHRASSGLQAAGPSARPVFSSTSVTAPPCASAHVPVDARDYRLPSAYRLHNFAPREVWWSPEVCVPEGNRGVMLNAEYPMPPHQKGVEMCYDDWAIRNSGWRHIGAMIPRKVTYSENRVLETDARLAHDCKGYRLKPNRLEFESWRNRQDLLDAAERVFDQDLLDRGEVATFFGNHDAVSQERLPNYSF